MDNQQNKTAVALPAAKVWTSDQRLVSLKDQIGTDLERGIHIHSNESVCGAYSSHEVVFRRTQKPIVVQSEQHFVSFFAQCTGLKMSECEFGVAIASIAAKAGIVARNETNFATETHQPKTRA